MAAVHWALFINKLLLACTKPDRSCPSSIRHLIYSYWRACKITFHPAGMIVDFPDIADTISSKIEVLERSVIDSLTENGRVEQRRTIILTSFDAGLYELSPFTFRYRNPKDTATYSAQTNALALAVTTVPVDTTLSFKDIKSPIEVA
jgi:hypothetical protein